MNENENEEINKLLNDYKSKIPNSPDIDIKQPQNQANPSNLDIALLISKTVSSLTNIISPKLEMQSIAFSKDDETQLYESIKPFNDQLIEFLKYIVYMPLLLFALGYALRIYAEIKQKKKLEKKEIERVKKHDLVYKDNANENKEKTEDNTKEIDKKEEH